ncbi:hypothetical protein QMP26_09610 [Enterocloster clostridioformis]|uniref:hypothetical protein n=1 Tax=Enterocloster clostridioformis TaxID=1531 RepID=UPI00267721B1|nr:hypothetical protein [Enterocloster clostridioformis]
MVQICREDKEKVYAAIREGHIDAADLSFSNLIDSIVLTMKHHGLRAPLAQSITDKRRENHHIPFDILMTLAVTAKLELKTSLTDVPFAVNDAELLSELGWNIWDADRSINNGLFSEGVMRKLISKYTSGEWVDFYNHYVRSLWLKSWKYSLVSISWTAQRSRSILKMRTMRKPPS